MAKLDVTKTELLWPGKYDEEGKIREQPRVALPFQVVETVNESRTGREAAFRPKQTSLFDVWKGDEGDTFEAGWRNKLIWGDNLPVMNSLLEKFAGKVDLVYIDPPFATGDDFTFEVEVGEGDLEATKDRSAIEEKAYRDTWGAGLGSFLTMIRQRLIVVEMLLRPGGSLFVHLDAGTSYLVRQILNEIFGSTHFCNEIIWSYRRWPSNTRLFQRMHDVILFYRKPGPPADTTFNVHYEGVSESYQKRFKGKTQVLDPLTRTRKLTVDQPTKGMPLRDVWDLSIIAGVGNERLGYPTQKPETLLERVIEVCSEPGDLVADFFCGSGTTIAVAEKLGRRWIGCDLGKFAINVARKRLLGIDECRPFELLNLGRYERQYWQNMAFGRGRVARDMTILEYIAFILRLYKAEPHSGSQHLHGKIGPAYVHVGSVDSPVTIEEIDACIVESRALRAIELHVLGWEWEMGLNDLMEGESGERGVKLKCRQIPREVMEEQASDRGDIRFFELAYLQTSIVNEAPTQIRVELRDFAIRDMDMIPVDVRQKITKWSDYIDYWAIDWDFQNDTFMNGWQTYRTRKDRRLGLCSDVHTYEGSGRYNVMVKVIDIFGNDTSRLYPVEVPA